MEDKGDEGNGGDEGDGGDPGDTGDTGENGMVAPPEDWPYWLLAQLQQDFRHYDLAAGASTSLEFALLDREVRTLDVREIDPRVSSVIDGKVSRISPRVISNSSVINRRSETIRSQGLHNRSRNIHTPRFFR